MNQSAGEDSDSVIATVYDDGEWTMLRATTSGELEDVTDPRPALGDNLPVLVRRNPAQLSPPLWRARPGHRTITSATCYPSSWCRGSPLRAPGICPGTSQTTRQAAATPLQSQLKVGVALRCADLLVSAKSSGAYAGGRYQRLHPGWERRVLPPTTPRVSSHHRGRSGGPRSSGRSSRSDLGV